MAGPAVRTTPPARMVQSRHEIASLEGSEPMSNMPENSPVGGWAEPVPGDWDFRPVGPIPFDRFVAELLPLYEPPLRPKTTHDKLRFTLRIVAELLGPGTTTAGLNPTLIARFIEARPPGESPHTTKALVANIRSACSYAKAMGYIRTSPFDYRKKWVRTGMPTGKLPSRDGGDPPRAGLAGLGGRGLEGVGSVASPAPCRPSSRRSPTRASAATRRSTSTRLTSTSPIG